MVASYPRFWTT